MANGNGYGIGDVRLYSRYMGSSDYISICDPRHSHLIDKNKWIIIKELNEKEYLVEYLYNEKPKFDSDFCKKYLPKISIKKPNKKIIGNIFYKFCPDIIDVIVRYLDDRYITSVEKRFCRNSEDKWLIHGDWYFYDPNKPMPICRCGGKWMDDAGGYKYQSSALCWKWYGGDENNDNIGWIQSWVNV